MSEKYCISIGISLDKDTDKKINDLMTLTEIHNRSRLIRLLVNYFTKNKDKIQELIKK